MFDDFQKDILEICGADKLQSLENSIRRTKSAPDEAFNQKTIDNNIELLGIVRKFVHFIEKLSEKRKTDTSIQFHGHLYHYIVMFLSTHSIEVSQIKNILGIDIHKVLRKYAFTEVPVSHKKLVL